MFDTKPLKLLKLAAVAALTFAACSVNPNDNESEDETKTEQTTLPGFDTPAIDWGTGFDIGGCIYYSKVDKCITYDGDTISTNKGNENIPQPDKDGYSFRDTLDLVFRLAANGNLYFTNKIAEWNIPVIQETLPANTGAQYSSIGYIATNSNIRYNRYSLAASLEHEGVHAAQDRGGALRGAGDGMRVDEKTAMKNMLEVFAHIYGNNYNSNSNKNPEQDSVLTRGMRGWLNSVGANYTRQNLNAALGQGSNGWPTSRQDILNAMRKISEIKNPAFASASDETLLKMFDYMVDAINNGNGYWTLSADTKNKIEKLGAEWDAKYAATRVASR